MTACAAAGLSCLDGVRELHLQPHGETLLNLAWRLETRAPA
jgi:hypothetical protein